MKKHLKSVWILLITALCVVICVVAFLGIERQYGDITTIVVQSPEQINYDADLTDTVTVAFAAASAETVATEQDLDVIKTVLEKRLEYLGVSTYDIYCDYDNKQVVVSMSAETGITLSWLVTNVAAKGDFYARAESSENATDAYIFSSDEVKSAKVSAGESVMNYTQYNVEMHLNRTGTEMLKTSTKALAETFEETEAVQYIYFYNGTTSVGSATIKKTISDGVILLSSYNLDQETVVQLGMYLNSGQLPFALTYKTLAASQTTLGTDHLKILAIALGSACLAIFIFLIARYRLTGAAGVICALGTLGVSMNFVTGFFNGAGYPGGFATLAGYLLIMLLSVETVMRNGSTIKRMLMSNSVDRSISGGMKANMWPTIRIYFIVLLIGCVMVMCKMDGLVGNLFLSIGVSPTYMTAVQAFGNVIVSGIFASFLFSVLGAWAMMLLLKDVATKPVFYGGVRNDG